MERKKILVADDNRNIIELVKMEFEILDYDVVTAYDGEDALKKIEKENPDLVILDVMMPKINGFDICMKLRDNPTYKDLPIVMLTAKGQEKDKFWGRQVGADEYVTKPFEPEVLEQIVHNLLEHKKSGEMPHAVTKLPGYVSMQKEIEWRKAQNEKFGAYNLYFEPEAFEVYAKKYGSIKADEILKIAGNVIMDIIKRSGDNRTFLGHLGDNTFVLVGDKGNTGKLIPVIKEEVNSLIPLKYDDEDRKRGFVFSRTINGEPLRVPLIKFVAAVRE
ncbi:MAG: response regulator [Nitrospirae bacterium]|nr:response regulator [Nitrospirota bacterium]